MKTTIKYEACRRFFCDDKESRNVYRVYITNKRKTINFLFGDSIYNTQNGIQPTENDILACIRSDYYITKNKFPTYEDFAREFGYELDSRKREKIYKQCIKQSEKLHLVFCQDDIDKMPE